MAIGVRGWTQRRLLYPLAIFAIIAPTAVLGLFGAYALKMVELRPSAHRQELRDIQREVERSLEVRLGSLEIQPPRGTEDIERAARQVETYFGSISTAMASACLIGVNGEVMEARSLGGRRDLTPPTALLEVVGWHRAHADAGSLLRESVVIPAADSVRGGDTWVLYLDGQTGGFVAWKLIPAEVERVVHARISATTLGNDALSLELVGRGALDASGEDNLRFETLGFVPIHHSILPDRYIALKRDKNRQFSNDDTFLSTMYIVIAVLCVPIVASATLMVVHMILREASEARKKVDFVSNVTHELKTPLTSIRMFVETLKLGRVKGEDQVNACLEVIMTETERLGALIDHVLSFSKVENQVKKYNLQPNNLTQVVRDTVSLFKAQMTGVSGEVRLKILPGVPSLAVFDKDAIREVLLNLLSNAIKYSGHEKFVTVSVGADARELWFSVQDKGIGIPQEELPRIFDKFYRVDQELSRNVDGTGLGLAICKEIISAHGGRIAVQSVLRKGSTFTVLIPFIPPRETDKRRHATTQIPASPSRRETQKVPSSGDTKSVAKPATQAVSPSAADLRRAAPVLALLLAISGLAYAQFGAGPDEMDEEPPASEPRGSLLPRPEFDHEAVQWVRSLSKPPARNFPVGRGIYTRHAISPDGEHFYYYRPVMPRDDSGVALHYALYVAGPRRPEARIADTGAMAHPVLFTADGRIIFPVRRLDRNEDGVIDKLDPPVLMISGRDGASMRQVAPLGLNEAPVALWRDDREVLLAVPGDEDANGWIESLRIDDGRRERLVAGFSVAQVLRDGRLLIKRLQPRIEPPRPSWPPRPPDGDERDSGEPLPPTLLEPPEFVLFDPEERVEESLFRSSRHASLPVFGENSFFGVQERERAGGAGGEPGGGGGADILIVDGQAHRDVRAPNPRYSYEVLGWLEGRGLLVVERGNLGSRLLLMDRALNTHRLADFDLFARGFVLSRDGRTVAWLQVEDTDENGFLEPWLDHSRPHYLRLE